MRKAIVIAVCVVLLITVNGCLRARDKEAKMLEDEEIRPVSSIVLSEEDARRMNEKLAVNLYFSDENGAMLVKEIRYIGMEDAKQGTDKLASVLVKELVKGPANAALKATLPEGSALRSPVKLEGRTAIVDMTKEFVDNHPGGKEAEEITIFSIVNTLTELKDIENVKFQINGKTEKEYKGNFRLDNEFPRNEELIDRKKSYSSLPEEQEDTGETGLDHESGGAENQDGLSTDEGSGIEDASTENYDEEILE